MTLLEQLFQKFIPYNEKHQTWPQVFAICVLSLTAVTGGALFTWTSPAIPILISNSSHIEPITLEQASYFTVIPPIFAIISVPFLSMLTDRLGRRIMIMFMSFPYAISWLLIVFAKNYYTFYVSRAIAGVADALLFSVIPMYMGEISTPKVRGSWGNMIAIGIYLGQLLINLVGAYCDIPTTAIIFFCIPVVCLILSSMLPESPYFCIMKQRDRQALEALKTLRWSDNVDEEYKNMSNDVHRQISESGTYKDLFMIRANRKALLISIAIRGCQQLSGVPAFAVYTQFMFNTAGGNLSGTTSSIIYNGLFCVCTIGVAFVVDKFGRKTLMVFSSLMCAIVLCIEATFFFVSKETSVDVSHLNWLPIAGMLTYVLVCSSGLGILPTLMIGELFSASIKTKALGILHISFSLYVLSISKLFQTLTSNFGMYVPFYLFACCCLLSALFSYFYVPETKGKTLEEIQLDLKK